MSKNNFKIISLLLTSTLILSACGKNEEEVVENGENGSLPQVEIMEVSFNGEQKYNVNGEVTASQSANLTAEFKANVRSVFAKPGDYVKKGDVLLLLDSESISQSFNTASQALGNTQQTVSQTYESAEKTIESARVAKETAETSYNNLIAQNKISRIQAEEALSSARLSLDLSSKSAQDALNNTINSVGINVQTAINTSDKILGVSETYKDAAKVWKNNLGTLKLESKTNSEASLKMVMRSFDNFDETYDSAKKLLSDTETMLENTLEMLKYSSTSNNYSQANLNSDISTVTVQISTIKGLLTSLISTQNSLNTILQSTNGKSQSIINAEAQYEATISQLNSAEDSAEKQLESAKIAYESAKKGAELSKTSAKSGLTGARGNFEQAKINQEKLLIKAPFDGTVIDIPVKTGDEVNMGGLLAQVENDKILKIIAYLTPNQANKLRIGDNVKIASKSSDVISAISSSVDSVIKKNKIEILHQNPYLHSGQTVPLTFTAHLNLADKDGVIFVPLIAVHVTSAESYVWVLDEEEKTMKRTIQTGEINGSQIAITSGLEEGDKIIVKGGRLFKKEGEEVEVAN